MRLKIVLLLCMLALPPITRAAGDAPLDRATLKGLGSLNVVVDALDPDLVKQGISSDDLRKELEGRLQRAGIATDQAASEFVGIRLLHVRAARGPYALCISVSVYQPVLLVRDKDIKTATETWAVETVLMADPKVLSREALTSVDELADRLVSAYRAVNPKK